VAATNTVTAKSRGKSKKVSIPVYRGIKDTWASQADRRFQGEGYWGVGTYYALDKRTAEDYATGDMTGAMQRWAFVTEYKFSGEVLELNSGELLDLDAKPYNPYSGTSLPANFPNKSAFLMVQGDDDYNPPEGGEQLLLTKKANVKLEPVQFWLYLKDEKESKKLAKLLGVTPNGVHRELGPFNISEAKKIEDIMKDALSRKAAAALASALEKNKTSFLPDKLVMLDGEFTGVDETRYLPLQFAFCKLELQNERYVEVGEPLVLYFKHDGRPENGFQKKFLTHIFDLCNKSDLTPAQGKELLHEWLGDWKGVVQPCGDCVPTDVAFLKHHGIMDRNDIVDDEQVPGTFHYEFYDLNAPKSLARHKKGEKYTVADLDEENIHDALVDCRNQTKELNSYLEVLLGDPVPVQSGTKPTSFPPTMTNKELALFWEQMAYGDWGALDEEQIQDAIDRVEYLYDDDTIWKLTKLKVADIDGHHDGHDASEEYINEYAKLKALGSDFPPLIVRPNEKKKTGKWETLDGQHRLFAAKKFGDQYIDAYVPEGGKVESVVVAAGTPVKISEIQEMLAKTNDHREDGELEQYAWTLEEVPLDKLYHHLFDWTPDQILPNEAFDGDKPDPKGYDHAKYAEYLKTKPDEGDEYYETYYDEYLSRKYSKLKTQAPPILVEKEADGRYRIDGGRHRARAAFLKGEKSIPAFVGVKKEKVKATAPMYFQVRTAKREHIYQNGIKAGINQPFIFYKEPKFDAGKDTYELSLEALKRLNTWETEEGNLMATSGEIKPREFSRVAPEDFGVKSSIAPKRRIKSAAEIGPEDLPEQVQPVVTDDGQLSEEQKQVVKTFERESLRAASFQDFQELLNRVLLEVQLTENFRPSVAGLLNEYRVGEGYVAL